MHSHVKWHYVDANQSIEAIHAAIKDIALRTMSEVAESDIGLLGGGSLSLAYL